MEQFNMMRCSHCLINQIPWTKSKSKSAGSVTRLARSRLSWFLKLPHFEPWCILPCDFEQFSLGPCFKLQEEDFILEELALMSRSYLKHGDVVHAESACPFAECWSFANLSGLPVWSFMNTQRCPGGNHLKLLRPKRCGTLSNIVEPTWESSDRGIASAQITRAAALLVLPSTSISPYPGGSHSPPRKPGKWSIISTTTRAWESEVEPIAFQWFSALWTETEIGSWWRHAES